MRICPNCHIEVDDYQFTCPKCHTRLPRLNKPIVGHASMGDLDSYNERVRISIEDVNMIRDKNHSSDSSSDEDDMDCAQPYNYVTHENGDRD
jgi:hypothetical protein